MTIRSLDPSGELGKLFFQIHSKNQQESPTNVSSSGGSPPSRDAVDLSAVVKTLQDFTSRAAALPEIRLEKIQALQQRLEDGAALATAEGVAGALLRETFLNDVHG
ncbi:MAG: flagellar biosynthesis anti-sigma factor FlgM [Nitrospirales bacterium]|nr:flagellar biosynthesis anti-sigma factor FlgM [Nitrospirales bacterium]